MPPTNPSGSLILEEPLVRTSYELLRRSHRSAQRQVEKDFSAVNAGLSAILKSLNASSGTEEGRAAIVGKLDQVSERAKGLKRKLDDIQPSAENPTPLRSRITYLEKIIPGATALPAKKSKTKTKLDDEVGGKPKAVEGNGVQEGQEDGGEAEAMDVDMEEAPEPAEEPKMEWAADSTLDRYIVDYLIRKGRMDSATRLAQASNIEPLVDIKLFTELVKIETALVERHSVAEALAWCGENRGTLKKTKNNLEFTLRLQEFIELCRKREITSAIAYSRKNLAGWAATHMVELQQGMTLLAFGEKTGVGMYRRLYEHSRWEAVRDQFRETFLALYAQPSQSLLALALSAGLSALRLPSCVKHDPATRGRSNGHSTGGGGPTIGPVAPSHLVPLLPAAPPLHNIESLLSPSSPLAPGSRPTSSPTHLAAPVGGPPASPTTDLHAHPDAQTGNVDCPTCGAEMKVLAAEVPMSHHVNSTIVCRISGKVMDSENEPMSFPNGYVYSAKALKEMAAGNYDVVTCPRTRESCAFARLRKVYIS
ncbi:hypothetical protein IAT38_004511 [Cryptococcus sp. DSM 104549]